MSSNRALRYVLVALLVSAHLSVAPLKAWGPHPAIVNAALAVLPAEDRIYDRLGPEAGRLRNYVWMGDWNNSFVSLNGNRNAAGRRQTKEPRVQFYANDYMVFPLAPRLYGHVVPDVLHTHEPFFLRALQALRTETPANAARWIGSLLHYVTDSGAPPHAAGISGDLHSKLENWLDASKIDISGYQPRRLGRTDEEALSGYLDRMRRLIEFSKERAGRARPFAERGDRARCEPIILESAIESAKAAADVLHTLFTLTAEPPGETAGIRAEVFAPFIPDMDLLAAKLVILNTTYSTMSEAAASERGSYHGTFRLRNLAPGTYEAVVSRPGAAPRLGQKITLKPHATANFTWTLKAGDQPGNLVQNPDFRTRWVSKEAPDCWRYDKAKDTWVSENIVINPGQTYRAGFRRKGRSQPVVSLEWMAQHWRPLGVPATVSQEAGRQQAEAVFTAPDDARYARIRVQGREDLSATLRGVYLVR
jgi:hypothetical protein